MEKENIPLNESIFCSLMNACGHCGKTKEINELLKSLIFYFSFNFY